MDQAFFEKVISHMRAKVHKLREDAGYSGAMHDGGSGALELQIEAFSAGLNRRLPANWAEDVAILKARQDPEFEEYSRLKHKFEGVAPTNRDIKGY